MATTEEPTSTTKIGVVTTADEIFTTLSTIGMSVYMSLLCDYTVTSTTKIGVVTTADEIGMIVCLVS